MAKMPIVFGSGMDRETGVLAMRPEGMEDLRNVHLLTGKFQVRRGFERVMSFTDDNGDPQTDVLAGIAMRGRRSAVYVTYDSVNYKVNIFVGDANGTWADWLAEWEFLKADGVTPILSATNADPPIVIAAEYNSQVYLAHSHHIVGWRAQTALIYWDSTAGDYAATGLTADWIITPDQPSVIQKVRFRGVTKHLEYIVGWGWGNQEEDRPELVRVSKPGVPLADMLAGDGFDSLHYWIPGDEGDPVIACAPAAETLLCFKESESFELFGDSFLDFGQRRLDGLYGMFQPRLAVNVEGSVFAWTNEGPRLFAPDGTSQGLEIPLELFNPEPYDLAIKGDDKFSFAVYMPIYRSVWFVFGKRVYSIYIRVAGDWKWGYQELGFEPLCGFRLPQTGWGLTEAPAGYPTNPTINDIADTQVDVVITNNAQEGDETCEVWLRAAGGSDWFLHTSYGVSSAATQETTLDDPALKAGWDYELASRFRRGSEYTPGYADDDPTLWPAGCKVEFTTTLASLPTIDSLVWSRTAVSTEQILVTVSSPYYGTGYTVELERASSNIKDFADITATDTYADEACTAEADNVYRIRLVTAYVTGAYSATSTLWAGPADPTISSVEPTDSDTYWIQYAQAGTYETEIYDSLPSELANDAWDTLRQTMGDDEVDVEISVPGSTGLTPYVGARHKVTKYGTADYSDYVSMVCSGPLT